MFTCASSTLMIFMLTLSDASSCRPQHDRDSIEVLLAGVVSLKFAIREVQERLLHQLKYQDLSSPHSHSPQ